MTDDFILENHPWKLLTEQNATFPNQQELAIMKGIMDGESIQNISKKLNITGKDAKHLLTHGMKIADVKSLYDLILWGLKTGVIRDEPLPEVWKQLHSNENPSYEDWRYFLNQSVTGGKGNLSKSTQDSLKRSIAQKFNLGPSDAKFIRFVFQVLNPISPPPRVRAFKPHVSHYVKTGVSSKYAMSLSKFQPADIDPDLHPNYQPIQMGGKDNRDEKGNFKSAEDRKKQATFVPPTVRGRKIKTGGTITLALKILGINPDVVKPPIGKGSFWNHPPEHLWRLLDLAKTRYYYEIAHAMEAGGSNVDRANRAKQVTVAWKFVKDMFKRRGFELETN